MRPATEVLVRGFASGLAGTTAMSSTTWVEGRLRAGRDIPVDYDATGHVVTAAATVLRVRPRTHRQRLALFLLVHWGYGSAVATGHDVLVDLGTPRLRAGWIFFLGCQAMAFVLFPLLGDTPPPWRWRRDVLASSLAQHLVYAVTVSATSRRLGRE